MSLRLVKVAQADFSGLHIQPLDSLEISMKKLIAAVIASVFAVGAFAAEPAAPAASAAASAPAA